MNEITLKFNDSGGIEIIPNVAMAAVQADDAEKMPTINHSRLKRNSGKIVIDDESLAEEILSQKGECFEALYAVSLVLNKHEEVIGKKYYFRKCDAVQIIIDKAQMPQTINQIVLAE